MAITFTQIEINETNLATIVDMIKNRKGTQIDAYAHDTNKIVAHLYKNTDDPNVRIDLPLFGNLFGIVAKTHTRVILTGANIVKAESGKIFINPTFAKIPEKKSTNEVICRI